MSNGPAVSARSTYVIEPSIKLATALWGSLTYQYVQKTSTHNSKFWRHLLKSPISHFWDPLASIKLVKTEIERELHRKTAKAQGRIKFLNVDIMIAMNQMLSCIVPTFCSCDDKKKFLLVPNGWSLLVGSEAELPGVSTCLQNLCQCGCIDTINMSFLPHILVNHLSNIQQQRHFTLTESDFFLFKVNTVSLPRAPWQACVYWIPMHSIQHFSYPQAIYQTCWVCIGICCMCLRHTLSILWWFSTNPITWMKNESKLTKSGQIVKHTE